MTHPFHAWLQRLTGYDADVVLDVLAAFDKKGLDFTDRVQDMYADEAENIDDGGDRAHDLWCERQDERFRQTEGQ